MPAAMCQSRIDRDEMQKAIEAVGPGEHGERVVLYEEAFHDEQAAYYDKLFADPLPLLEYYRRLISRQVYSYVQQRDFVVDLCCGTGKSSLPLLEKGIAVVAMDVSREMLRAYRKKCLEMGHRAVLFVHADASRPPLRPNSCPAIMMIGGLHHIRDQESSISTCHRALVEGGLLILHEPLQTGKRTAAARLIDNLYAITDPGRMVRALRRRLGMTVGEVLATAANDHGECDFTPYERPFRSPQELLSLMPRNTDVVAIRSQGVLSFHAFAPPVQRRGALAQGLAKLIVGLDDRLSGDARQTTAGDALFAVCRKAR
jgi:SAM-dependent methyltransferase